MNSSGHLPVSETAAKRVRKGKAPPPRKRGRPRNGTVKVANSERPLPSAGTLARTKALLLAALRVWELKHRLPE